MPPGALVTVPLPPPALVTVSMTEVGCKANVAVTAVAVESDTEQVPVPEQPAPLQPEKAEPAAAPAERVTLLPAGKVAEQVEPQLSPAGELVTVPVPAPALLIVSATDCKAKVAETVVVALRVTEQVPVPEQPPPLHPENIGTGDRVRGQGGRCPRGRYPSSFRRR